VPDSLPELSELDSEHTSASGYSSGGYEEEETYEGEEEETDPADQGGDKEAEGEEEGGEEAAPEATPTPTPTPAPSAPTGGGISPG